MTRAGAQTTTTTNAALRQITLGILTWRRPATLRHTLKSYARAGLLDAVGEVILFANASDPREIALAKKFDLRLVTSPENIGIGPAFTQLTKAAQHPYFLFLENDWPCIEPAETAQTRLAHGIDLLQSAKADAVRFRHRNKFGHPLYSKNRCAGHELNPENLSHIMDAVHWTQQPDVQFPDHIQRATIDGDPWYFASAQHAAYTNNPCLYRTDFARNEIAPRGDVPGLASEAHLQDWWRSQTLTVAMGEGLFTHRDPGKEWRRAGRIIKNWVQRARRR